MVGIEKGIASGRQWVRRVTRKGLCANLDETADKDVTTNDSDGAIHGGRADRPSTSGMAC
jgi:hypothetical protein